MKLKSKITILLFFLSVVWILILSTQNYKYPEPDEIEKRINYLRRVINQPLDSTSEIMQLGNENYEFMLFTYAYSSYAMTNLAIRDTAYKSEAIDLINTSIKKVLDYKIYSYYGIEKSVIQFDSLPHYSVLYLGHLNLMIGCYRLLSTDSTYNNLNSIISESLYQRYSSTKFINLESYPSSIWMPDNAVAIASLKLYSVKTKNHYDEICVKWIEYAKRNYLDKNTSVLYSTIHPQTGEPIEEPRGSMLGWSIMFIYQFDKDFAVDLYNNYKKHFSKNLLLFRIFKERYNNTEISSGDIDSGPIFLGYSIPANEFALSNSILAGDFNTAKKLERLISIGTKTINRDNEIKYNLRFLDMNISPMSEALVLNSLTITNWTNNN